MLDKIKESEAQAEKDKHQAKVLIRDKEDKFESNMGSVIQNKENLANSLQLAKLTNTDLQGEISKIKTNIKHQTSEHIPALK